MQSAQGPYVGWVVAVKAHQQMAVVLPDNCSPEPARSPRAAVVRTLDGLEIKLPFTDLDLVPRTVDAIVFRTAARAKFPGLRIF